MNEDGKFIVTTSQLMELFDVSRQTISNWKDQGCPKRDRGKFDLRAVIKWRLDNEIEKAKAVVDKAEEEGVDLNIKKARLNLLQIEVDERRKKVAAIDDIHEIYAKAFMISREHLLTLPEKASADLVGVQDIAKVNELFTKHIHDALYELSLIQNPKINSRPDRKGKDSGADDTVASAGKKKRKRVGGRKTGVKSGTRKRTRKVANRSS